MNTSNFSFPLFVIAATMSVAVAAPAKAVDYDLILRQALSRSDAGPLYAYDVLYERPDMQAYIQVNPAREKGKRVTVTSPPESLWDAEFAVMLNEMDGEADTQFWCSDFAENVPETATVVDETELTITYEYRPVPVDEDDELVMPHMTGQIKIARQDPAILSVRMYAIRPFSPMLLGRFERFNLGVECGRLPDGRSHVLRVEHSIKGKIATETIDDSASWQVLEYREVIE